MTQSIPAFQLSEYRCCAGPGEPAFEEHHHWPTIAMVREGRFTYHGEHGTRLLEAGSLLLGNGQQAYACSHEDSHGDFCEVIHYNPATFEEVAATATGSARFRFSNSALPGADALLPWLIRSVHWSALAPLGLLQQVMAGLAGTGPKPCQPNARETRAVRAALDLIKARPAETPSLATLAAAAGMSKFHFARCFTKVIGISPNRYLLNRHLSVAAHELAATEAPVSNIAFDSGFGDLSTFNLRFRKVFGTNPRAWRLNLRQD